MDKVTKDNRNVKDSVFTDLFYSDIRAKENLLSLYNALFDTDLSDVSAIKEMRLDDVLFRNMKNDISFLVGNQRIVLGEQQSTINENMPLRFLMYIARQYEVIIPPEDRYKKKLIKIPAPMFFTFYNGKEDQPAEKVFRLSDAFILQDDIPSLELTVTQININSSKKHRVLEKCGILKEYSLFVDQVRKCSYEKEPLENAVKNCIKNGILREYLQRKSNEVINMLMAEYDYDTDIQVQRKEAEEEGRKEGQNEERNFLKRIALFLKEKPYATDKEIAENCSCTEEKAAETRAFLDLLK